MEHKKFDRPEKKEPRDFTPEQLERWRKERLLRDNINELIKTDGFHYKSAGRQGVIYYVSGARFCEFEWEQSTVKDYHIVFKKNPLFWYPEKTGLSKAEQSGIESALKDWLAAKNMKTNM